MTTSAGVLTTTSVFDVMTNQIYYILLIVTLSIGGVVGFITGIVWEVKCSLNGIYEQSMSCFLAYPWMFGIVVAGFVPSMVVGVVWAMHYYVCPRCNKGCKVTRGKLSALHKSFMKKICCFAGGITAAECDEDVEKQTTSDKNDAENSSECTEDTDSCSSETSCQ